MSDTGDDKPTPEEGGRGESGERGESGGRDTSGGPDAPDASNAEVLGKAKLASDAARAAPLKRSWTARFGGRRRGQEDEPEPRTFWNWLRQTARLWGFLAFILVILVIFRGVILPFVLALLVAYVLSPVLNFCAAREVRGRRLPRFVWLILLYIVLFGLGSLFFTSLVPRVADNLKVIARDARPFWERARKESVPRAAVWLRANFGLPSDRPKTAAKAPAPRKTEQPSRLKLRRLEDGTFEVDLRRVEIEVSDQGNGRWLLRAARPRGQPVAADSLEARINRQLEELVASSEQGLNRLIRVVQKALFGLLSAVTTLILVFMISAFLLIDSGKILGTVRGLVDRRYRDDFDNVMRLVDKGLSGAIRGQLLICLVNGVLTWIGLRLFKIDYDILLAILAAIMSLIPIFGSILSTVPIVLVALASGQGGVDLLKGTAILLWIIGIHLLEANLLNPKIIGTAARIHPVVVIFAVVAGERSYGPFGALLAVPLVSAVQAVFLYVRGKVQGPEEPERRGEGVRGLWRRRRTTAETERGGETGR